MKKIYNMTIVEIEALVYQLQHENNKLHLENTNLKEKNKDLHRKVVLYRENLKANENGIAQEIKEIKSLVQLRYESKVDIKA